MFCLERQIADSIKTTVHQLVRPGYKEYKFQTKAVLQWNRTERILISITETGGATPSCDVCFGRIGAQSQGDMIGSRDVKRTAAKWNRSQLPDSNLKCGVQKQSKQSRSPHRWSLHKRMVRFLRKHRLIIELFGNSKGNKKTNKQTNTNQRQKWNSILSNAVIVNFTKHDGTALIVMSPQ